MIIEGKMLLCRARKRLAAPEESEEATAMRSLWLLSMLCVRDPSVCEFAGGTITIASVGNGCRPHPRFCSKRLRFCPEAVTKASQLTRQSRRKRNRCIPCHCLPSPKSGSTQT